MVSLCPVKLRTGEDSFLTSQILTYMHQSALDRHPSKSRSLRHDRFPHWPRHPPPCHSKPLARPSSLRVQTRHYLHPNAQQAPSNPRDKPIRPPATPKTCPRHPGNPRDRSSSLHLQIQARSDPRNAEPRRYPEPVQSDHGRGESGQGVWW